MIAANVVDHIPSPSIHAVGRPSPSCFFSGRLRLVGSRWRARLALGAAGSRQRFFATQGSRPPNGAGGPAGRGPSSPSLFMLQSFCCSGLCRTQWRSFRRGYDISFIPTVPSAFGWHASSRHSPRGLVKETGFFRGYMPAGPVEQRVGFVKTAIFISSLLFMLIHLLHKGLGQPGHGADYLRRRGFCWAFWPGRRVRLSRPSSATPSWTSACFAVLVDRHRRQLHRGVPSMKPVWIAFSSSRAAFFVLSLAFVLLAISRPTSAAYLAQPCRVRFPKC